MSVKIYITNIKYIYRETMHYILRVLVQSCTKYNKTLYLAKPQKVQYLASVASMQKDMRVLQSRLCMTYDARAAALHHNVEIAIYILRRCIIVYVCYLELYASIVIMRISVTYEYLNIIMTSNVMTRCYMTLHMHVYQLHL